MNHELRIIPTGPDKYLMYCTAGDFIWHADESGDTCQLDLGRHEYRQHLAPTWTQRPSDGEKGPTERARAARRPPRYA